MKVKNPDFFQYFDGKDLFIKFHVILPSFFFLDKL